MSTFLKILNNHFETDGTGYQSRRNGLIMGCLLPRKSLNRSDVATRYELNCILSKRKQKPYLSMCNDKD